MCTIALWLLMLCIIGAALGQSEFVSIVYHCLWCVSVTACVHVLVCKWVVSCVTSGWSEARCSSDIINSTAIKKINQTM